MSNEVFEKLCAMDKRRIELQIVLQCAPTLAGMKTSNLLIVPKNQEDKVRFVLRHSGFLGYRLVEDGNRVVFLIFDRDKLTNYLSSPKVKAFLMKYGYEADSFGKCLRFFKYRYASYISKRDDFPHEMGVFLGYPLGDVVGFIEHQGEDFSLSGYWKVYENAEQARVLFEMFDKVKDEMILNLYNNTKENYL